MSEALVQPTPPAQVEWKRFTLSQRLLRYAVTLLIAWAVVQSLRAIEVIPEFIYDAPAQMGDMLQRMWPLDWSHYRRAIIDALIETLHMATVGTLLALVMAIPVGLMAARNVVRSRLLNFVAKVILVSSRTVNSLIWALLFVAILGPGPLAGMLAIGFRSIGFLGKLMAEALEQSPPGPVEALQAAGASRSAQLWYGHWPHIKPALSSIVLLRWDINVRESGVLGLVGAGGIGVVLDTALNLFQWNRVAAVLLAVLAVVVVAEVLVTWLRRKLI